MIRSLTDGERAIAIEAFGSALELEVVRILTTPWPFDRAFVPGRWFGRDWIAWPSASLPPDIAEASVAHQATLVHELTHVWQSQNGVNLLLGKLRAGDGAAAYRYPVGEAVAWDRLSIEQQAMVVEHRFKLSRGMKTPEARGFYDRLCPWVDV